MGIIFRKLNVKLCDLCPYFLASSQKFVNGTRFICGKLIEDETWEPVIGEFINGHVNLYNTVIPNECPNFKKYFEEEGNLQGKSGTILWNGNEDHKTNIGTEA